jgi:hypothetical protein
MAEGVDLIAVPERRKASWDPLAAGRQSEFYPSFFTLESWYTCLEAKVLVLNPEKQKVGCGIATGRGYRIVGPSFRGMLSKSKKRSLVR